MSTPKPAREALLDAVAVVLGRDGIGGLSLRQVALAAGVSHGAPGALFGDRAGMLAAFAARGFLRLAEAMATAATGAADGRAALAATGRAYASFARAEPEAFQLMFREDLLRIDDPELSRAREVAYGPLKGAITRAVREGFCPPERADAVLYGAWAMVHGLASLMAGGLVPNRFAGRDQADVVTALTEMYARSLMPGGDAG
ncbi:MAG: TetR/AcrR family transcriptional regulator [Myxococcales bacterium]|nr:TetR/AcrR family transcriptional regulator [Myxococcales bacterium]MCB9737317.1 TetR/AcrR family transcriptional regulator [Deltaproteobacteria bacterium]